MWQFRGAVVLFGFALALAATLRYPIGYVTRRGLPRGLAIALIYLISLGFLGGLLYAVGNSLIIEAQTAGGALTVALEHIRTSWPTGTPWQQLVVQWVPRPDDVYAAMQSALNLNLVQTGIGFAFGFFDAVSRVALVLVLSVYWSIDQDRFERWWLSMLQAEQRMQARQHLAGHRGLHRHSYSQHNRSSDGRRAAVDAGL